MFVSCQITPKMGGWIEYTETRFFIHLASFPQQEELVFRRYAYTKVKEYKCVVIKSGFSKQAHPNQWGIKHLTKYFSFDEIIGFNKIN